MKAFIYARVSSDKQEREGFSIPAQLELLRGYAARHGIQVVGEYVESETAGKAGRAKFNEMLANIKDPKHPAKAILVEKTDRITRNFYDEVVLDELIHSVGLEIHFVKEGEVYGPNATTNQKMFHGFKVLIAKGYIDNLKDETRKGIRQKVKNGQWWCKPPYGYLMIQKGHLIPDPARAPLVQRAFALYATGEYSMETLSRALVVEGYQYTPTQKKIPPGRLHVILHRRVYMGEIECKGEIFPGTFAPLVSPQTFEAVQQVLKGKSLPKGKLGQHFKYAGVATCGHCGGKMVGEFKKNRTIVYYRCWRAANKQCNGGYINEKLIDAQVSAVFKSMAFPDEYREKMAKMVKEMDREKRATENGEMERLTAELKRVKSRLSKAYDDRLDGIITGDKWAEVQERFSQQIQDLQTAMGKLGEADLKYYDLFEKYFELPKMLMETWDHGSPESKAALLQTMTSNLTIQNKEIKLELHSPFNHLIQKPKTKIKRPSSDILRTILIRHGPQIIYMYNALSA